MTVNNTTSFIQRKYVPYYIGTLIVSIVSFVLILIAEFGTIQYNSILYQFYISMSYFFPYYFILNLILSLIMLYNFIISIIGLINAQKEYPGKFNYRKFSLSAIITSFMCVLTAIILGIVLAIVNEQTSSFNLGYGFYALVIGGGLVSFLMTMVFKDSKK